MCRVRKELETWMMKTPLPGPELTWNSADIYAQTPAMLSISCVRHNFNNGM